MGCFSFICGTCGQPINVGEGSGYLGEHCALFLLKGGKVLEMMQGQYDSYGRVYLGDSPDDSEAESNTNGDCQHWESMDWDGVCELMFSQNENDGIAAYHTKCTPIYESEMEVSESDDEQGWGEITATTRGEFKHIVFKQPIDIEAPVVLAPAIVDIPQVKEEPGSEEKCHRCKGSGRAPFSNGCKECLGTGIRKAAGDIPQVEGLLSLAELIETLPQGHPARTEYLRDLTVLDLLVCRIKDVSEEVAKLQALAAEAVSVKETK